jgi:hypothetical protein
MCLNTMWAPGYFRLDSRSCMCEIPSKKNSKRYTTCIGGIITWAAHFTRCHNQLLNPKPITFQVSIACTCSIYLKLRTKASVTFTPICVLTMIYIRMTFLGLDSILNGKKVALSHFENFSRNNSPNWHPTLDIGSHLLKPLEGTGSCSTYKIPLEIRVLINTRVWT